MRIVYSFIFFFISIGLDAQIAYPVVGQYKNRSAQGMAIYANYAYLFNDGGLCRRLNLKTGDVDCEFFLESADKNTHVNCACFSHCFVSGGDIPALYITEFYGQRRCFVELINDKTSKLIQTIEYVNEAGENPFVREWIVDSEKQMLYAVIREDNRQKVNVIKKFLLPRLEEGSTVVLKDVDILDEFSVSFMNGLQGGKIQGRYMYLVTGFSALQGDGEYYDRKIIVIDLKNKKLVKNIDLNKVTMNEPEDIDFYKGRCLLFAAGTGGVYNVF